MNRKSFPPEKQRTLESENDELFHGIYHKFLDPRNNGSFNKAYVMTPADSRTHTVTAHYPAELADAGAAELRPFLKPEIHAIYALNEQIRPFHITKSRPGEVAYFFNDGPAPISNFWFPFPEYHTVLPNFTHNHLSLRGLEDAISANGVYPTHGNCPICFSCRSLGTNCECRYGRPPSIVSIISVDGVCFDAIQLADILYAHVELGPGFRYVGWTVPPRINLTQIEFTDKIATVIEEKDQVCKNLGSYRAKRFEARDRAIKIFNECVGKLAHQTIMNWWNRSPENKARFPNLSRRCAETDCHEDSLHIFYEVRTQARADYGERVAREAAAERDRINEEARANVNRTDADQ